MRKKEQDKNLNTTGNPEKKTQNVLQDENKVLGVGPCSY